MNRQMRKIVKIDEDKCVGCGLCVPNCAEGAIKVIDGKARLIADNLCDGLGNCLGTCPFGAITIEERPAANFDPQAVEFFLKRSLGKQAENKEPSQDAQTADKPATLPCGCPGTMMRKLSKPAQETSNCHNTDEDRPSRLSQFPVQLALLPTTGSMWAGANVLLAADCVGFVMPDFHEKLLAGPEKILAVACPKLDDISEYIGKLTAVFANNDIRSITIAHMEVPCCNGLVRAVNQALENSGRGNIPVRDITVAITGQILEDK